MAQKTDISISRDCGYVMRGLAIVMIALHNFCHLIPHVAPENEFRFFATRVARFEVFRGDITMHIFDILSFFGWYGVPVFMFLTGYGLVMKYERDKTPLKPGGFIGHNYLKLFFLMLPAVVVLVISFFTLDVHYGTLENVSPVLEAFLQLTMLPDLFVPWWSPQPGVFWYFGLTMEFYIIYAFFIHGKRSWWMWALVALSLGLQFITNPGTMDMEWIRHNATGWMTVLAFGIIYGRTLQVDKRIIIATVAASLLLFWPSMLNSYSWQFSILAAVVIIIAAAKVSMLIPGWRSFWIWIGRLSPYLFVAHPVTRSIAYTLLEPNGPSLKHLAFYAFITLVLALILRPVTQYCYRLFLTPHKKSAKVAAGISR